MKLLKTATSALLVLSFSACAPKIYKSENFEASKETVKTMAVLPFNVTINNRKLPKGTTQEMLRENEQKTGYAIQDKAYSWLLQRNKNYTVTFQDIDRTNALLKAANISYNDLTQQDKGELCKILKVDGILSGKATLSKPMSEGAAVALGLLVGAWGSTNQTVTTLTIHDVSSSLLWKYDYEAEGSVGSSPSNLANALMRNASKKFPYKEAK
ncbi:MAG: hypothetical protein EOO03_03665 [Chitinophagaceae bacterium]|nr:MAG: hypothetical protein EOO03_03665 [Chitinophagaceae bacterium]